jgi:hypothetical protein
MFFLKKIVTFAAVALFTTTLAAQPTLEHAYPFETCR